MKLCLFSVSYGGLWGQPQLPLPDFINRAADLGYRSVMLMGKRPHLSPLDATPALLEKLKAALDKRKVSCDVIGAYTDLSSGGGLAAPAIEFQIAYVESLARIGAELGASIVRIFTAYETPQDDLHANWRRVVATVREMCDRVAAHGSTIAIQNHHDLGIHTDLLLELLAEIDRPNCKLGFDAWSPALRGEDLYESARKAAPFTVITTNADYVSFQRFAHRRHQSNYERLLPDWMRAVPFGTGSIDYPAFFKGLRDGGFDGVATYEMCSPLRGGNSLENLDRCAKAYVDWMRANQPATGAA